MSERVTDLVSEDGEKRPAIEPVEVPADELDADRSAVEHEPGVVRSGVVRLVKLDAIVDAEQAERFLRGFIGFRRHGLGFEDQDSRLGWRLHGAGKRYRVSAGKPFQPGDSITVEFYRDLWSASDTCLSSMSSHGIGIEY